MSLEFGIFVVNIKIETVSALRKNVVTVKASVEMNIYRITDEPIRIAA